jgi:RNA polymerase sigma-70 factor, ECF subfamily
MQAAATHASPQAAELNPATSRAQLPPPPTLPPLPESDEDLFRLYAETDSDRALREVVNRYQPKIMRLFQRNPATRSRAEDLTQEVFIRIIRNRASFDPTQKFSTWSKTIAERIAINAARGVQRSRVTSFTDLGVDPDAEPSYTMDPADTDPLPDRMAELTELREILHEALEEVDERYRLPAELHFLEGLTHTEAAARLGIPLGTAKSRTHHAIADLRRVLSLRFPGLIAA